MIQETHFLNGCRENFAKQTLSEPFSSLNMSAGVTRLQDILLNNLPLKAGAAASFITM